MIPLVPPASASFPGYDSSGKGRRLDHQGWGRVEGDGPGGNIKGSCEILGTSYTQLKTTQKMIRNNFNECDNGGSDALA